MNIFLDESAPKPLAYRLKGHAVESAASMDWRGIQNGKLLRLVNAAQFDVFITSDKNMIHQQPMSQFRFATLVLSTNDWKAMRNKVQPIRDALSMLVPGSVSYVDCGEFVPKKHRE